MVELGRYCFRPQCVSYYRRSATTQLKEYVRIVGNTAGKDGVGFSIFTSTVIFEGKVDCAENDAKNFGGGVDVNSKSLCLFVNTVIFTGDIEMDLT